MSWKKRQRLCLINKQSQQTKSRRHLPPPVPNKNISHWVENGKSYEVILVEDKKMGRPTTNPRNHRESFRLSDDDMDKINYCMAKTGMSKTDVIRTGIDKVYQELKK